MGWVNVQYEAGQRSPIKGEAEFDMPNPEFLEALMMAMTNGLRFPIPGMPDGGLIVDIDVSHDWGYYGGTGWNKVLQRIRIRFIA